MFVTTAQVAFVGLSRRADIYHIHDPELIPVALMFRLLGKRVVYDAHEDLPRDILELKEWIPPSFRRIVAYAAGALEWIASRVLSAVVAATPTIADRFPAHRTVVVQNFPPKSEFATASVGAFAERRQVLYLGNVTASRGAVEMVRAIDQVEKCTGMRLVIAGQASPPELLPQLEALPGWSRTDYLGWVDRVAVRHLLATARVGLVVLHPVQGYTMSQPTKLFEYMSAGVPVIASDFPLWRQWVSEPGCGLCVPPHDTAAIAAAITWTVEHPAEAEQMGQRGRELVLKSLNWEQEEQTLLRLYERLNGPVPRS